jgi:hypothetical protein
MEIVVDAVLTLQEWTTEHGLLTAAQKAHRVGLAVKFKKEIAVSWFVCRGGGQGANRELISTLERENLIRSICTVWLECNK